MGRNSDDKPMMRPRKPLKKLAVFCLFCFILIAIGCLLLFMIRAYMCETETLKAIDISGLSFVISVADCKVPLASEEWISVWGSKVGEWRKTLLFEYDPAGCYSELPSNGCDNVLPSLRVSEEKKITISIPAVSSVRVQNRKWQHGTIDYEIGRIISNSSQP